MGIEGEKEPWARAIRYDGPEEARKEKFREKKINFKFKGQNAPFVVRFAFVSGSRFCGTGRKRAFWKPGRDLLGNDVFCSRRISIEP